MWTAVLLTWDSAGVRTRVSFVSIDIALRCSAEIGYRNCTGLSRLTIKKTKRLVRGGRTIALAIHSLDCTLQLLNRDMEIAPTERSGLISPSTWTPCN